MRFGANKLQQTLNGEPVWRAAYQTLLQCVAVDAVGLVVPAEEVDLYRSAAPEAAFVVAGGNSRQASARAGIEAAEASCGVVLIHDAARAWVDDQTIFNVISGVRSHGAAYAATAVTDTVREVTEEGTRLLRRDQLVAAQTPQGALLSWFRDAHARATEEFTDDVAVLEAAEYPAVAVPGDPRNRKLTHASDLPLAPAIRVGFGYDIHAFSSDPDRPLWLGGIEFPNDKPGLEGHSDADALVHAVVDALLGSVSLGDIGLHYPNTDPRWKNCPSLRFLAETASLLSREGWHIISIDASVLAERPKVMPRKDEICAALAGACGIDPKQVSLKATTNEGLGAIGRGEGIAAMAVATVAYSGTSQTSASVGQRNHAQSLG